MTMDEKNQSKRLLRHRVFFHAADEMMPTRPVTRNARKLSHPAGFFYGKIGSPEALYPSPWSNICRKGLRR
jgi:hypothetical protein